MFAPSIRQHTVVAHARLPTAKLVHPPGAYASTVQGRQRCTQQKLLHITCCRLKEFNTDTMPTHLPQKYNLQTCTIFILSRNFISNVVSHSGPPLFVRKPKSAVQTCKPSNQSINYTLATRFPLDFDETGVPGADPSWTSTSVDMLCAHADCVSVKKSHVSAIGSDASDASDFAGDGRLRKGAAESLPEEAPDTELRSSGVVAPVAALRCSISRCTGKVVTSIFCRAWPPS